jgi:hypothetical protein
MRGRPSRYNVHRPDEPDQNRCEERAQFSSTAPGRNPHPSPHSFDRLGPPFCGRVQSLCDGLGAEAFQISAPRFRPLDKDDAVPTVRKADAREMRWRPSRCNVQPPMSLTRPNPRPSPPSFPSWAGRSVGQMQSMCDGLGGAFQISAPSIKDDAVPMVRKAVRGRCDGRPVGTTYNRR